MSSLTDDLQLKDPRDAFLVMLKERIDVLEDSVRVLQEENTALRETIHTQSQAPYYRIKYHGPPSGDRLHVSFETKPGFDWSTFVNEVAQYLHKEHVYARLRTLTTRDPALEPEEYLLQVCLEVLVANRPDGSLINVANRMHSIAETLGMYDLSNSEFEAHSDPHASVDPPRGAHIVAGSQRVIDITRDGVTSLV